jgi:hypothetical protein
VSAAAGGASISSRSPRGPSKLRRHRVQVREHQPPAGTQRAAHLGEHRVAVRDEGDQQRGHDPVERGGRERKPRRIGGQRGAARRREHLRREVGGDRQPRAQRRRQCRVVSAARPEVEDVLARQRRQHRRGLGALERQQRVAAPVARGGRGEHLANARSHGREFRFVIDPPSLSLPHVIPDAGGFASASASSIHARASESRFA